MNRSFKSMFLGIAFLIAGSLAADKDHCHRRCKINTNVFAGNADNNFVSITYLTAGKKKNPTVLLIHGNGGTADDWRGVMEEMCKDFYLVAPNRRGTCPSGQPQTGEPRLACFSIILLQSQ